VRASGQAPGWQTPNSWRSTSGTSPSVAAGGLGVLELHVDREHLDRLALLVDTNRLTPTTFSPSSTALASA
jgi:hypothetical protein